MVETARAEAKAYHIDCTGGIACVVTRRVEAKAYHIDCTGGIACVVKRREAGSHALGLLPELGRAGPETTYIMNVNKKCYLTNSA